MTKNDYKDPTAKYIFLGITAFVVLIFLIFSVYIIGPGTRGVIMTWGKPSEDIRAEGLHFKFPVMNTLKKYDVKVQKLKVDADGASLDLQDVQTIVALNFHLNPAYVNMLHQEIGKEYKERIIDPAIQESVKAATAQFSAE